MLNNLPKFEMNRTFIASDSCDIILGKHIKCLLLVLVTYKIAGIFIYQNKTKVIVSFNCMNNNSNIIVPRTQSEWADLSNKALQNVKVSFATISLG